MKLIARQWKVSKIMVASKLFWSVDVIIKKDKNNILLIDKQAFGISKLCNISD